MTKRQDLCLQQRSRPEQSDQRQPNQAANISHQPRASPNSTPLASRIEFPTMTGQFPTNKPAQAVPLHGSISLIRKFNGHCSVQRVWLEPVIKKQFGQTIDDNI